MIFIFLHLQYYYNSKVGLADPFGPLSVCVQVHSSYDSSPAAVSVGGYNVACALASSLEDTVMEWCDQATRRFGLQDLGRRRLLEAVLHTSVQGSGQEGQPSSEAVMEEGAPGKDVCEPSSAEPAVAPAATYDAAPPSMSAGQAAVVAEVETDAACAASLDAWLGHLAEAIRRRLPAVIMTQLLLGSSGGVTLGSALQRLEFWMTSACRNCTPVTTVFLEQLLTASRQDYSNGADANAEWVQFWQCASIEKFMDALISHFSSSTSE